MIINHDKEETFHPYTISIKVETEEDQEKLKDFFQCSYTVPNAIHELDKGFDKDWAIRFMINMQWALGTE